MKPIRVIRHEDWITAGHFTDTLDEHGIPYVTTAIDQGDTVPRSVEDISGLVLTGCTRSVNDGDAWAQQEISLIKRAMAAGVPVLGHCFGSQLLAKALGASIYAMSAKEIGWYEMTPVSNPVVREWLGTSSREFEALVWHHDAFTLPQGATPLFGSTFCPDQAFVYGDNVATVGHLEVTAGLIENWLRIYGYDLEPLSPTVQDSDEISRDVERRVERMHCVTDSIYARWLEGVHRCEAKRCA